MGFVSRLRSGSAKEVARRQQPTEPAAAAEAAEAETAADEAAVDESDVQLATTTSPEFDRAVPDGVQVAASWAWRVLAIGALIYYLASIAAELSEVTIPLALGILLAAMLYPVAVRLRAWGVGAAASTVITVLGGLALLAGALTLVTTQIAGQVPELSSKIADGFQQLSASLQNGPLHLPAEYVSIDRWTTQINSFLADSRGVIAGYAATVGAQVGHFVAGFALTLFSLFYFLYDGRGIFTFLLKFVPQHVRARVDDAANKGWHALSSYVRAVIIIAFTDAIGVLIAAEILRVPVAPALSLLVFIGAFVPIVGSLVSGFVAVLVALVALGWVKALIMLGAIILVVELEGHVLQPLLLGRAVKLHPLAVLLAIASGIILGGIVGALLAVPLLAFTKSFVQHLVGTADLVPTRRVRWPGPNRRR